MKRRALLTLGAGAAALGAWWANRADTAPTALDTFWASRFARPGGGELLASSLRGRPLLLNFWATWCPPCVHEMPLLERFFIEHRHAGWQVLGLALDEEAAVLGFLKQHRVSFPVALAGLTGVDLTRTLGNPAGGLPFSIVTNANNVQVWSKIGAVNDDDLRQLSSKDG